MARSLKRWSGGVAPFGYQVNDVGRIVRHPAEQLVVVQLRRWRRAGKSFHAIAGSLTRSGIPTKTGSRRWHAAQIRKILLIDARIRRS